MLSGSLPVAAEVPNYTYLKVIDLGIGKQEATVNGLPITVDQPPYVKNGRALVPLRFLGEILGATVNWDNDNRTASLNLNGREVKVTIDSIRAMIDDDETTLDVPAEIKEGRTFIPLRFVSEALGYSVEYNDYTQRVKVAHINTKVWEKYANDRFSLLYPSDWTVTGDINTKLIISSPVGTVTSFEMEKESFADTLEKEKYLHKEDGFQLVMVTPPKYTSYKRALFVKPVLIDTDESEIINLISCIAVVNASSDENSPKIAIRTTTKQCNSIDISIIDRIESSFRLYEKSTEMKAEK